MGVLASPRRVQFLRRRRIEAVVPERRCSRKPSFMVDARRQAFAPARVIVSVPLSSVSVSTACFESRLADGVRGCLSVDDLPTRDAAIASGSHVRIASDGKRGWDLQDAACCIVPRT